MTGCAALTAVGASCARRGDWTSRRGLAYPSKPECYQHAVATARADGAAAIFHVLDRDRTVRVGLLPKPRRRFKIPTTPVEAIDVLSRVRSLSEYTTVFCAVMVTKQPPIFTWSVAGTPIVAALNSARHRLLATASPAERFAYDRYVDAAEQAIS